MGNRQKPHLCVINKGRTENPTAADFPDFEGFHKIANPGWSWGEARYYAKEKGYRLPYVKELEEGKVKVKGDAWIPVLKGEGEKETGRRDGYRAEGKENIWANIGERAYLVEYPAWGNNSRKELWEAAYFLVV